MADAEPCSQCGSTRFHEQDGVTYCHNGHDQGRGLAIGVDDGDFGKQGTIVRKKGDRERSAKSRSEELLHHSRLVKSTD
jgi:hypothetical protein